jgi:hypothetical protein
MNRGIDSDLAGLGVMSITASRSGARLDSPRLRAALGLSAALHAMIVVALLEWQPDGPPAGLSRAIHVRLGTFARPEAPVPVAQDRPAPAPPADAEAPPGEPSTLPVEAPVPVAAARPAPEEPLPEPLTPSVASPARAASEVSAARGPSPAMLEVIAAPAVERLATNVARERPVTTPQSPQRAAESRPSAPVPVTRPMASAEREMLEEQALDWVEHLGRDPESLTLQSWQAQGRTFAATFTSVPAADDASLDHVLVEISTEHGGDHLTATMRMTRLAFSSYAQFVDRWDPSVQIHDDVVDGRFHSNSEVIIGSSRDVHPSFLGRVTTASRRVNTSNIRGRVNRDQMFLGGLETGVRRIFFPKDSSPQEIGDSSHAERAQLFERDARIEFFGDGSFGWRYLDGGMLAQQRALPEGPNYLVAADKADLYVSGVVAGTVLVYSPDDIVIEGDLRYADDPVVVPDSEDFLGLVAEKSVEVAEPDVTGHGDLRIDAAIYARRRFAVRRYSARDDAELTIFGSLTAGTVSATEPRFATRVRFDARLESQRPPGFPVTDRYELGAWDVRWQVEPVDDGD